MMLFKVTMCFLSCLYFLSRRVVGIKNPNFGGGIQAVNSETERQSEEVGLIEVFLKMQSLGREGVRLCSFFP